MIPVNDMLIVFHKSFDAAIDLAKSAADKIILSKKHLLCQEGIKLK